MIFSFDGQFDFWGPAAIVVTLVLGYCVKSADWRGLFLRSERLHLFCGSVIGLSIFWVLRVNVYGLLALHPLLIMALCMVFGIRLGLLCGATATALSLIWLQESWVQWPVRTLMNVVIPGAVAWMILVSIDRLPLKNLFVYILGAGFFGAMGTVQAMALASVAYVWLLGPEPLLVIVQDNYYLSWLLMFPEGFINGAVVTGLTVLKPELVKTYDDMAYLGQPEDDES